jgi:phosphomannomutase / phosphoglucomutase
VSAWKACDLRGPYPDEINEDLLRRVAAHVVALLPPSPRVLIASDFRASGPSLKACVADGLTQAGAYVIDAGQVPTPIAYFGHNYFGTDAVLIVTASHNPPSDNGLKLMLGSVPPSTEQLAAIRGAAGKPIPYQPGGQLEEVNLTERYVTWIVERWHRLRMLAKPSVVIDAGGGVWSDIAPRVFEALHFDVEPLFCEIDGQFRFRNPDCARTEHLGALSRRVLESGAQLGIAWDGDGDRVAFVDETGAVASADQISIILARFLLRNRNQDKIVYDVKLSSQVAEAVRQAGGTPLIERSGHAFLKRRMIDEYCLFGCEASGHYFYRELRGGDDGLFTALLMAEVVATEGSLKSLVAGLPPIYATSDLRVPSTLLSYEAAESRLHSRFSTALEVRVDGCRFDLPSGSVLIRQSVTEPVITVRIEGVGKAALDQLIAECREAIPELKDWLMPINNSQGGDE